MKFKKIVSCIVVFCSLLSALPMYADDVIIYRNENSPRVEQIIKYNEHFRKHEFLDIEIKNDKELEELIKKEFINKGFKKPVTFFMYFKENKDTKFLKDINQSLARYGFRLSFNSLANKIKTVELKEVSSFKDFNKEKDKEYRKKIQELIKKEGIKDIKSLLKYHQATHNYDFETLAKDIQDKKKYEILNTKYHTYRYFDEKLTLCGGSTIGLSRILRELGYETIYYLTQDGEHAYLLVKENNKWYHIETTRYKGNMIKPLTQDDKAEILKYSNNPYNKIVDDLFLK